MGKMKRWAILLVLSSALFLIVMDMTVLYTALPRLTHELGASASEKMWILNAYPLVVCGLLPGLGTLGDRLGHKSLFVSGLVVFCLASLGAAFSPNAEFLIGFRALLAVGAAMMMPATLSLIRFTFTDEKERAMAIGIWAAVASGGAALGPVVGGVLLEYFWWGSVFLINVPVVAVALVSALVLIPANGERSRREWDLIGSVQIMVALLGGVFAIKEFGKPVPSYGHAALALVIGIMAAVIFVRRQNRRVDPLIDFALFRKGPFALAVAAALVVMAALTGMELVVTQRLQLSLGMSPLQSGLFLMPLPLAAFFAGPVAGWVLPRLGAQKVLCTALTMAGAGMVASLLLRDAPLAAQVGAFLLCGAGLGAAAASASSTIMHNAPMDKAGMAASIEEVSFELGGVLGVTLLGSLMSAVYAASLTLPVGLQAPAAVVESLDGTLAFAAALPAASAEALANLGRAAFDGAYVAVMGAGGVLLIVCAVAVALFGAKGTKRVVRVAARARA